MTQNYYRMTDDETRSLSIVEKCYYAAEKLGITEDDITNVTNYTWPNWNDHVAWLETASIEELISWWKVVN